MQPKDVGRALIKYVYDVVVVMTALVGFVLVGQVVHEHYHATLTSAFSLWMLAALAAVGLLLRRLAPP
jgi:hypothetical protein